MIKQITYQDGLSSFWVERAEDGYLAYLSFKHYLRGITSPMLMAHLGRNGLRAAYFSV